MRKIISDLDVFFYEAFTEERVSLQRNCPKSLRVAYTPLTIQEMRATAVESSDKLGSCVYSSASFDLGELVEVKHPPASVISIRTQSIIPLDWAVSLKAVLTRSAGYDHLQRWLRTVDAPVPVCGYLPMYCANAVAEQAMLLWMALLRKLPRQLRQYQSFDRDHLTGSECEGKKLLVVGVGNIGGRIARIGQALGMEVTACDLVERYADLMYRPFEEAMSQADIIVAAMNVTPENINYFNYEKLRHVRQGALFINVARGELAVISDIERLLVEGRLGGVALDVYNREPELAVQLRNRSNAPSDPEFAALARMQQMDNVLLTPHNAFNTAEAVARKAEQSIRQIEHHRATGSFLWPCPM